MKRMIISLFCIFISFSSFSQSWKKELKTDGGLNQAAINAIIDFSNRSKFFKKDTIFELDVEEDESGDIIIVSIHVGPPKALIGEMEIIGSRPIYDYCPTDYKIVDGKLFYWHNKDSVLTEELLNVLKEYDHVIRVYFDLDMDMEAGNNIITIHDESKIAVHYYLCKDNLTNYKRVNTSIAVGWYEPPKLKCKN